MYVYFVQSCDNAGGLIKVGMTKNISKRMETLQTGCPSTLKLLGSVVFDSSCKARHFERRCHETFAFCLRRGEWFSANQHLRELASSCAAGAEPFGALGNAWKATRPKAYKIAALSHGKGAV